MQYNRWYYSKIVPKKIYTFHWVTVMFEPLIIVLHTSLFYVFNVCRNDLFFHQKLEGYVIETHQALVDQHIRVQKDSLAIIIKY
jgi:hypothetical protein